MSSFIQDEHYMEELINKYLQESLTTEEAESLRRWLQKDSDNRKVFENIVGSWNLSDSEIEEARKKVFQQITHELHDRTDHIPQQKSPWKYLIGSAACIALIALVIIVSKPVEKQVAQSETSQEVLIEKETAPGQKLTFELPDGSIVKLNAGSKLTYPRVFGKDDRKVILIGEAFFSVTRNENKPFRITSNDMLVEVLGTSFNVRSYPDEDFATVAVKSGKVAVKGSDDQVLLLPKEAATLRQGNHRLLKSSIDNELLFFGWMDQQIIFYEEDIGEIFKILSRWYDVKFDIQRKLDERKEFTAKYKNPVLTEVMESLSYAYEFDYTIDGKNVMIK